MDAKVKTKHTGSDASKTSDKAQDARQYPERVRQPVLDRSRRRRAADPAATAPKPPHRTLCRADFRHRLHGARAATTAAPGPTACAPRWCTSPISGSDSGLIRSAPFDVPRRRPPSCAWSPLPIPSKPTDFVAGITTLGGNGNVATQTGMAAHIYAANTSMTDHYFYNADGEMLVLPQQGLAPLRHRARRRSGFDVARRDRRCCLRRPAFPGRAARRA